MQQPEFAQREPWARSATEVLTSLDSSADGLTRAEAATRLARTGRNELPPPARQPLWRRLLKHFDDVLIYILIGAAVLKAISGEWIDFAVITVVILATGLIGFIQEGRAESALAGLHRLQSVHAQVRRERAWGIVDAATLVPGDVVRVRSGDRVPADVRLHTATNLQLDESALTGEAEPSSKDPAPVSADAGLGDRCGMLYAGTIVTGGRGAGVVVATGTGTEIGRISALVATQDQLDTPLSRQLGRLGKQMSIIIGLLAAVMLLVGRLTHDWPREELLSAAIAFAVAAVPEGLPALVTITLALGVQQMARHQAITRKMAAVETLGAVTTICSDKTGTLTQNEMTARVVVTAAASYRVEGTGYAPEGRILTAAGEPAELADHPQLAALTLAVGVCNDARLEQTETGWRVVGQPTEGALAVLARKAGAPVHAAARIAHLPFESAHKYAATLAELPGPTGTPVRRLIHLVGAPDRLLDRCATQQGPTAAPVPLDRPAWEARIEDLSGRGLRVLAAAAKPAGETTTLTPVELEGGLTFLGIVGILDPPRPEATAAIAEAHGAGIRVKMITGDHPGTAIAISRELGIAPATGEVAALTGSDLAQLSQDRLGRVVREVDVYARTSPEHKLRIVRALQSHGEVVAMTGDGVNDAPSITRADVGVAMGIKGTEATKDAADIVLADDNFATIERAVHEGRRIYDNIRKSVVFLLPSNGSQSLVVIVAVLLGITLPLSPLQILWVNLVTTLTLTLALTGEPAEAGIMRRPPRSRREPVLTGRLLALVLSASVLIGGATLGVYLLEFARTGNYAVAQTTAVLMLALGQLAFLFNCRFLHNSALTWRVLVGNRAIWISAGLLLVLQLTFTYAPFMNLWFETTPIGPHGWGLTLVLAVVVFLLAEAVKAVLRHLPGRASRRISPAGPGPS
ncbi:cation-translocating P-type ATPase [Granulicoccus phenolivorans]|uniref:cation-translocating P-type ATPase n=1 Tax=Granulicoccus phenolivorans TaxID=266854 RepID=UPI00040FA1DB|nr:HAD-IC family P-type ATPase [Granulicoccus phenolivorans]